MRFNDLTQSITYDFGQTACSIPPLNMQPIDLQELLNSSLHSLRPRLKSASAGVIQVVCEYGDLSVVDCSVEISQVFTSLIAQAIDALSGQIGVMHRPQVRIRTMQIPDPQGGNPRAVICVADNGAEIPFAMQREIFNPSISTASTPRAISALAAGYDLATCYEIVVNQHGGDLQCYSQAGSTEFWIELPVNQLPQDVSYRHYNGQMPFAA